MGENQVRTLRIFSTGGLACLSKDVRNKLVFLKSIEAHWESRGAGEGMPGIHADRYIMVRDLEAQAKENDADVLVLGEFRQEILPCTYSVGASYKANVYMQS